MTVQGYPKLLIPTPTEGACSTFHYVATPALSYTIVYQRHCRFFLR